MATEFRMNRPPLPFIGLDRIFWPALALYLAVLPVAGTTALRYLAFVILLAATGALLIRTRAKPELPFAPCWLAYFLVALISVINAVNPEMSRSELRVEVVYWIVIFIVGITWGRRMPDFGHLVLLLATINAVLTLSAFHFASMAMDFSSIRRIPSFAYAGMDGNWLLVVVFFLSWLVWRLWQAGDRVSPLLLGALIILDVWAMMATQNRQNLVALGIGVTAAAALVLSLRFSWRRISFFLVILALIAALVSAQMLRRGEALSEKTDDPIATSLANAGAIMGSSAASDVRWDLWKFSLEKIAEHPWVGGGIGRSVFDKLHPEFMRENAQLWHAHNMILNKGIQMGIPGMIAFLALWIALALELLRHARQPGESGYLAIAGLAALVAIFAKNMTDDFFVRNVALFFWLATGLLVGHLRAAADDGKQR